MTIKTTLDSSSHIAVSSLAEATAKAANTMGTVGSYFEQIEEALIEWVSSVNEYFDSLYKSPAVPDRYKHLARYGKNVRIRNKNLKRACSYYTLSQTKGEIS